MTLWAGCTDCHCNTNTILSFCVCCWSKSSNHQINISPFLHFRDQHLDLTISVVSLFQVFCSGIGCYLYLRRWRWCIYGHWHSNLWEEPRRGMWLVHVRAVSRWLGCIKERYAGPDVRLVLYMWIFLCVRTFQILWVRHLSVWKLRGLLYTRPQDSTQSWLPSQTERSGGEGS